MKDMDHVADRAGHRIDPGLWNRRLPTFSPCLTLDLAARLTAAPRILEIHVLPGQSRMIHLSQRGGLSLHLTNRCQPTDWRGVCSFG
jgi:hypothetical protein